MKSSDRPKLRNPAATALRDDSTIQVDLDPNHSLLISGEIAEIRSFLSKLDGEHCVSELQDLFPFASSLLRTLIRRGLVETELLESSITSKFKPNELNRFIVSQRSNQSAATSLDFAKQRAINLANSYISLHTAGPASALTAIYLALQQVGRIKLHAQDKFKSTDLPFWLESNRNAGITLAEELNRISSQVKLTQPAGNQAPDFAVIADSPWQSLEYSIDLINQGIAHLVIDTRISEVSVGPLVIPGKSSCLNCAEIAITNVDRSWSTMRKLLGQNQHDQPDWLLLNTAVSFAGAQIVDLISSGNAVNSKLLNQRWRFRLPGPQIEVQKMPLNMFCFCQWGVQFD
jgi:hypothetical protein